LVPAGPGSATSISDLTRIVRTDDHLQPEPANAAFTAMALHQLGRKPEAKAAIERLRDLCKDEQFAEDKKAQAFLAEAETILGWREQ